MKTVRTKAVFAVASGLAMFATGCSSGSTGADDNGGAGGTRAVSCDEVNGTVNEDGPLAGKLVAYVDALPGNVLLDGIAQGLANSLNEQGAELVRVFQTNAQNQVDLSIGNLRIQEALAQGADAIVVFPLDANSMRPGLREAEQAGVPTFLFQDIKELDATGKLAWRDIERGKETAAVLADMLDGSGTATVLSGLPSNNVELSVAGAVEGFEAGGLELVGDPNNQRNLADDAPGGQEIAQTIFAKNPDLNALVTYNSASATGAIAAAKQAGVLDKVLIGTVAGEDTNIAQIKSGELEVAYDLNAITYGQDMATELIQPVLEGEELASPVVEAQAGEIFTADNADDFVPWCERLQYIKLRSNY